MGNSITKIKNSCGQIIEVGKTYQLNQSTERNTCSKRESNLSVKVTEIRDFGNGWILAKIDFPRDPKHNVYLQWVPVSRLYEIPLVASVFRPLSDYLQKITRSV